MYSENSPQVTEHRPRRDVVVPAADGYLLRGTMFRPQEDPANEGYAVLTYCYRGTGRSGLDMDLRNENIRMSDWITQDTVGVIAWAKEEFAGLPHFAVGHAVGGHGIAYAGPEGTFDAAALVNVRGMRISKVPSLFGKIRAFALFNIIGPVSAALTGHIPASGWKLTSEPPLGVMRQWASWARKRDYFFSDPEFDFAARFARATQPFLSIRIPDDYWTEESSADLITDRLSGASSVEKRLARPARGQGVGYGGYFRRGHEKEWDEMLEWFEAQN